MTKNGCPCTAQCPMLPESPSQILFHDATARQSTEKHIPVVNVSAWKGHG